MYKKRHNEKAIAYLKSTGDTVSLPASGCITVVVNRYEVVIHVRDPVALTPVAILDTAVETIVCSMCDNPLKITHCRFV